MNFHYCFFYLVAFVAVITVAHAQPSPPPDFQQGKRLFEQGYYERASSILQQCILAGDSLNPDVLCLYSEALSQSGQFDLAKASLQKIREIANKKEGGYYHAKFLLLSGDVHLKEGQLHSAEELYLEALQACAQRKFDTLRAVVYRRMGFVKFSQGQYEAAGKYARSAFLLMKSLLSEKHADWADYYKLCGAIHDRQANFDSAAYYYKKSYAIHQLVHGDRHPETAKLLVNQANIYHVRGANIKAAKFFRRALDTMQEFLGKDHILVATIYNNMAIVDFDLGNFEKAVIYYQHALNIFQQKIGNQSMHVAQTLNNISSAYLELKDPEKAREYALQSLKIRERQLDANNMLLAPVFVNLAGASILQHKFVEANSYSRKVIRIYNSHGEELHPDVAESYVGLGESYLGQGRAKQALKFFTKARELSLLLYGSQHAKIAFIHNLTAHAYRQLQQSDSALFYYNRAISSVLSGYDPDDIEKFPEAGQNYYIAQHFLMEGLQGKAEVLYLQYQANRQQEEDALIKAYQIFCYLSGLIDDMRNAYQREEAKLFLSEIAAPVYARALDVAWDLYQHTGDSQYIRQAFSFSEKSKYVLLSDFTNDVTAKYTAGIPKDILEEEQNLKSRIAYYEKQVLETSGDSTSVQYESTLAESKKAYLDFVYQLEHDYPQYYQLKYNPKTATVAEVQKAMKEEEQLVEYALSDSALYIFSISADSFQCKRLEIQESLEVMVRAMRKGLLEHNFSAYTENAWKLYQLLVTGWGQEGGKVIIIPDGILGHIPFEALLSSKVPVTNKSNYWRLPFLLEDYIISYNYSATFYLSGSQKNKPTTARNAIVGFAPEFATDTSVPAYTEPLEVVRNNLVNLQGAQQELKRIAEIFQGKFFFGSEATEAAFKRSTENSRLIHIGTHGIMNDENPAMSHLVFSSGLDSLEDNLLHTYEIYNLKLNAELVTLSACNTGTGQLRKGEGVMSMARGFAYAGCPNVVTSLWAASDYATAQLMQRFYYYLGNGWEKDKALHQAKLDFLEKADGNLANPYYWSSFILIGDDQPVQIVSYRWLIWLVSMGAVLSLVWLFYRKKFTG